MKMFIALKKYKFLFLLIVFVLIAYYFHNDYNNRKEISYNNISNNNANKLLEKARLSYEKGIVYQNLIPAFAKYQQEALSKILFNLKTINKEIDILYFHSCLDNIILSVVTPFKEKFLKKAASFIQKVKHKQLYNEGYKKLNIIIKNLSKSEVMKQDELFEILVCQLNDLTVFSNRIIKHYIEFKNNKKDFYFEDDQIFQNDFQPLKIKIWSDELRLYNPLTLYCASQIYLNNAYQIYQKADKLSNHMYYYINSMFLLKKYKDIILSCEDKKYKHICESQPFILFKKAISYHKINDKKKSEKCIKKIMQIDNIFINIEYSLFIAEVKRNINNAINYLLLHAPDEINEKYRDYHNLTDSRGFSNDEYHQVYYYRTLGQLYQLNGNEDAAFRCLYFTFQHSHGLNIKKIDPVYISKLIYLALNQNVRPLLNQYLLRPPSKSKTKSFIDYYPGCFPLMYYLGCIET